jgi:hypothetical protein
MSLMTLTSRGQRRLVRLGLLLGLVIAIPLALTACSRGKGPAASQRTFSSPEEASDSLIAAAERFDVNAMKEIFGPDGVDLVVTEDQVQDKNQTDAFVEQARLQNRVVRDPAQPKQATLVVGPGEWPLPIPIVETSGKWWFDTQSGREEVLRRRIGQNELDAIDVCEGYVEAQHEYATTKHDGAKVNQYAQRVMSTPGKHDGLAWRNADGAWDGPVGEAIAQVISEGYTDPFEPYHGYYFKILKAQGPAAHLGEMDYVVQGAMIGGFAFAAAPAEYEVTGIKTFIVNHDGIIYEKDLGPETLEQFRAMERFNPDSTWTPVPAATDSLATDTAATQ